MGKHRNRDRSKSFSKDAKKRKNRSRSKSKSKKRKNYEKEKERRKRSSSSSPSNSSSKSRSSSRDRRKRRNESKRSISKENRKRKHEKSAEDIKKIKENKETLPIQTAENPIFPISETNKEIVLNDNSKEIKIDILNQEEKSSENEEKPLIDEKEINPEELMKMMGFSNFKSTKEGSHKECNLEAVAKNSKMKRKYRQYMNRKGGFNKPLDSI